jgi:hypothetical protein
LVPVHYQWNIQEDRKMPAAVPVTFKDFLKIEAELRKLGFVPISGRETMRVIVSHGLESHRKSVRHEAGFKYYENGYLVKVWTSCYQHEIDQCRKDPDLFQDRVVSRPAGTDVGWILIVDPKNWAQYFARPVLRTKNFVRTFLRRAWITQRKIKTRPLCEQCEKYMEICAKESGATFWVCYGRSKKDAHEPKRPVFKDWDHGLPPRALQLAKAWRKEFRRYLKKEFAKGNQPRRANTIRKGWKESKNPYP